MDLSKLRKLLEAGETVAALSELVIVDALLKNIEIVRYEATYRKPHSKDPAKMVKATGKGVTVVSTHFYLAKESQIEYVLLMEDPRIEIIEVKLND